MSSLTALVIRESIAYLLAEAGANVVIAGRDEVKNQAASSQISRNGGRCRPVRCDVDDLEDIDATIDETINAFGGLQILVNNAGIAAGESPEDMSDALWDSVVATNLRSVFRFSRQAFQAMKQAGFGKIINIGSMYSIFGSPLAPSYSASKGGVIQLTKSLSVAWAKDNIQVNAILPGWISTEMTAPIRNDMPDLYEAIIARTPAGRFGMPEECAGTAVFLASDDADYVTGSVLRVDGGIVLKDCRTETLINSPE